MPRYPASLAQSTGYGLIGSAGCTAISWRSMRPISPVTRRYQSAGSASPSASNERNVPCAGTCDRVGLEDRRALVDLVEHRHEDRRRPGIDQVPTLVPEEAARAARDLVEGPG